MLVGASAKPLEMGFLSYLRRSGDFGEKLKIGRLKREDAYLNDVMQGRSLVQR